MFEDASFRSANHPVNAFSFVSSRHGTAHVFSAVGFAIGLLVVYTTFLTQKVKALGARISMVGV